MRRVRVTGTHAFSRYATDSITKQCTGVTQPWAEEFMFDKIAGYTEFSALFDQYMITKVTMNIQLMNNPDAGRNFSDGSVNNTSTWFPKLWWIRDYDGGGSDTLLAIKERQGVACCVLKPNVIKRIVIRPMCTIQTYRTATTTGYAPKRLFIDLAAGMDVPHYGLNLVIDTLNTDPADTQPYNVRIDYKYEFSCKGVR